MKELMNFKGNDVEVLVINGVAYFNPYHCGSCLGLSKSAVRNHLSKMNKKQVVKLSNSDVRDKDIRKLNNAGESFLTESGVYKLVFKSNKPEAEEFENWVTDEVLPNIRKYGMYAEDEILDNPDLLIEVATRLKQEKEKTKRLEAKVKQDKPKVIFAEALETSETKYLSWRIG